MRETTEFKLPKRVTDAIEEYQKYVTGGKEAAGNVRSRNAELAVELATAERELEAAMDRTIAEPTAATERAETEARRKVTELRMTLAGGNEREARAYQVGTSRSRLLAEAAIRAGKEEATRHFEENVQVKLQVVADAKYAYLKALADLHTLKTEAYSIWKEAGQQTSPSMLEQLKSPHFQAAVLDNPLTTPVYGMVEPEITRAAKHGVIYGRSVGAEREILGAGPIH